MRILVFALIFLAQSIVSYGNEVQNLYRTELFTYGGIPTTENEVPGYKVLVNIGYAVGYSEDLKDPLWAVYRLGNMKTDFSTPTKWERPFRFQVDIRTDAQIDHDAYKGSGFDRGHMTPNAAMLAQYGQMAQLETFLMSNICPQSALLNQGIWARLEGMVREEISQDDTEDKEVHDLFVITGPIFEANPVTRLDSGVAVPTSFYKILAFRRGYLGTIKAIAFIFPQDPQSDDFLHYVRTVDEIENLTGLDFFPKLSPTKQHNLESKRRGFDLEELPN